MDLTLFIVIIILIASVYYLFTLVTDLRNDIKQMTNTCMNKNENKNETKNKNENSVKPLIEFLVKMKNLF
jgi:hypothetical protein